MKKIFIVLFVLCFGCSNVLKETAKTDTPAAVYYQAKLEMNKKNYNSAILLLQSLGPAFLADRSVSLVYASAYSGRCGLDFVSLVNELDNLDGATTIFSYLFSIFPGGSDSKIADCVFSESVLLNFGDQTQRTSDENILMGLSSLAKVGTVLSRYADADGDGAIDPGFDHCDTTDFPDDAVREIGTGIALAILSVSSVAADITSDTLTEISELCGLSPSLNSFCTTTDKNTYSPTEVAALRAILGSGNQGIAACPGDFTSCLCP